MPEQLDATIGAGLIADAARLAEVARPGPDRIGPAPATSIDRQM